MGLRDLGYDEYWLQDRLAADPGLLGLGEVTVVTQELSQTAGGALDLLLECGDTHFSVEVQLGGVDASHAFRALEYWTRHRAERPNKRHVAVIAAERMTTRYGTALRLLAVDLPLIAIELEANRREDNEVLLTSRLVAAHEDLGLEVDPLSTVSTVLKDRTHEAWKAEASPAGRQALEEFERFVQDRLGHAYMDYRGTTYIGVRRGRRLWAKFRPIADGISINTPDPDGGRVLFGGATEAFATMREALSTVGATMNWQAAGDGVRPVNFHLRPGHISEGAVDWALYACWEAYEDVAPFDKRYWSSRDEWRDSNETTGFFRPYYCITYHDLGDGRGVGMTTVDFCAALDDSETLLALGDDDWDDQGFARRVLVHHTEQEPTKTTIRRFLAGLAGAREPGEDWSLYADDLSAWLRDQGL